MGAAVWFHESQPDASVPRQGSAPSSRTSSETSPSRGSPSVAQQRADGNGNSPLSSPLQVKLGSAANLRAFVLDARDHPELGGHLYAATVLNECAILNGRGAQNLSNARIRDVVTRTATVENEVLQKRERMQRRCADLTDHEIPQLLRSVEPDPGGPKDALYALQAAFDAARKSGDSVAINRTAKALLESRDPILLSANGARNLRLIAGESVHNAEYWFQEERYSSGDAAGAVYRLALMLAACAGAQYCSMDQEIAMACMVDARCHDSRTAFVASQLPRDPRQAATMEKITSLAQRMKTAIDLADVSAFRPPA